MPSWDRPRGGGDSGGDKPPVPKVPPYEPPVPTNPPQARSRSYYERSAAEQGNRSAAEGTSQDSTVRPKDKPPGERGTHGGEGAAPPGDGGGDQPRRPTDTSRETGKHADSAKQYQTLFERQGEVIDTQRERIGTLKDDIGKLEKRNEKLEDRNDKLQDRNGKLETRLEQKDQTIDRQAKEIERLKAENAGLREKANAENKRSKPEAEDTADKPGAEQSEVERAPNARSEESRDAQKSEKDTPFYRKIPSQPVTDIATKTATAVATIGVATGALNGTAEKVAGGVAAIGLAVMEYRRQKNKEKDGQDD